MMAAQLRGAEAEGQVQSQGIGQALKANGFNDPLSISATESQQEEKAKEMIVLENRASESRSPYVRAHAGNPVAWQIWGDEAIELARRENRLLFVSIGYSACHCESIPLHLDLSIPPYSSDAETEDRNCAKESR